jgi:hypothetical protein
MDIFSTAKPEEKPKLDEKKTNNLCNYKSKNYPRWKIYNLQ